MVHVDGSKDLFTAITYKAYRATREARIQNTEAAKNRQINATSSRQNIRHIDIEQQM